MTAQIHDSVNYRNELFMIAAVSGTGLFDPADEGLKPIPFSTACWRGYHCTYEVVEGELQMTRLNIGLEDDAGKRAQAGELELYGRPLARYEQSGYSYKKNKPWRELQEDKDESGDKKKKSDNGFDF